MGGHGVRLLKPVDPDRLLDDPHVLELNRNRDYMPYWAYLWDGANLLAEAVVRCRDLAGRVALEIGCGLGLPGLVGLKAGLAQVVFSDYDPAPFEFISRSAEASGIAPERVRTRILDWQDPPRETFSLILGADVIYEHRLVPMVTNLLDRVLAPGGTALISSPFRVSAEAFGPALRSRGLNCDTETMTARAVDGRGLNGTIFRISR